MEVVAEIFTCDGMIHPVSVVDPGQIWLRQSFIEHLQEPQDYQGWSNTHFNPYHLVSIFDVHDVLSVHAVSEELVDDLELVRVLSRLPLDRLGWEKRSSWRKFLHFLFD